MNRFDIAIIGAGQAGVPLARAATKAGRSVVLFERKHLGGSCVNFGCTPSKGLVASAALAHQARRASEYGIRIPTVEVDFAAVMERARGLAEASRGSLEKSFAGKDNPRVVMAHARLDGEENGLFRIIADGKVYHAAKVVLDTGTRAAVPDIEGLSGTDVLDGANWIHLDRLPPQLVFLGGGTISVEMAQAFRRLGSEVTVIESGPAILSHEDTDIQAVLRSILEGEGIRILTGKKPSGVVKTDTGIAITLEDGAKVEGSHLFLGTGRLCNTDDLGLDSVGVTHGKLGVIDVDHHLATSHPGLYAAGDIRGGAQFTNTAYEDHVVLRSQLLEDGGCTNARVVDYAVFTDPELGRVGLDENQAKAQGVDHVVGRYDMKGSGKAAELGQTEGFIKVIVEKGSKRILGATALCHSGSEVVQLFTELIAAKATTDTMIDAVHIHPTLAEAAKNAVAEIESR